MGNYEGHTPEPWTFAWNDEREYSDGTITAPDGSMLAVVGGPNYGLWRDAPDGGITEFQANGRLMSDAPKILRERDQAVRLLREARGIIDELDGYNTHIQAIDTFLATLEPQEKNKESGE